MLENFITEKRYNEWVSLSTEKMYRHFLWLLENSWIYTDQPSTFTTISLRRHLATTGSTRGWLPVSYNTARKIYRTYCEYLVRDKLLQKNPFDDIPKMKEPSKLVKSVSSENIKTLRYLLLNTFNLQTFVWFRDFVIFQTFLYTGMRRKELLDLKPQDFDLYNQTLSIRNGKWWKGRIIPVSSQLLSILSDWQKMLISNHSEPLYLFPSKNNFRLSERNLRDVFDKVKSKIDFPLSPHRLRHTFATELVRNDVDIFNIAFILWHSSVKTTQIYLTADTESINRKISWLTLYS